MCKSARVLAEECTVLIFRFACCSHNSFPPAPFPTHAFSEHAAVATAAKLLQSCLTLCDPIEIGKSTRLNSSHSGQSRMPSSA